MSLSVVEGWTERIKYTLTADGATVNLTGMSVTLLLYDVTKTLFSYSGTSGVDTASSGIVYFDPAATDLLDANAPYYARWKVTDGAGKVSFFPNSFAEQWTVRKP